MKLTNWLKSIFISEPDFVWFIVDEKMYHIDRKEISSISIDNISQLYLIPEIVNVILSMKNGKEFEFELTTRQYQTFYCLFIDRTNLSLRKLSDDYTSMEVWMND